MKKIFVTYTENGKIKKGELTENMYKELTNKTTISEVIVYPNALIMEQNFTMKTSGSVNPKQMLHG